MSDNQITTEVRRGDTCGSACVPIFLAGKRRIGALSSLWYFHPVWRSTRHPIGVVIPAPQAGATEDILARYFSPAGVSPDWLLFLRRMIGEGDLWQTGRDLWDSKSGILTETLDNLAPRREGPVDLPTGPVCGTVCRG